MNNKMKPRSSLKKVPAEEDQTERSTRRRISFSGKKFVREFDTTEKPGDYDNSYEISDHTNGDDSSRQSHVTAAACTLQITTRNSMPMPNDMDKENTPLVSVRESISTEYDQQNRNDFTLQLQTSVNVTLMPHELTKHRPLMDLSAPLESMAFDSLSLSDVERDKLRENSIFKMPVSDKTMDLMPYEMEFDEVNPTTPEKENLQNTVAIPTDMSCVEPKERDVKQKTVLFENNNITCDFTDIDPQQVAAYDMGDKDSLSSLLDDSTSSPLIPLDVISENGIRRKMNFRELNEALNSGRIQPFPNGPRTPTTARNVKSQRFWHGLEQQPMEQARPLREAIEPRGTLNFNESIMMSPIPQQQNQPINDQANEPFKMKSLADVKRNNRYSQADELMLDNTNFLAHAKMGDETQSRNSSKSTSRRETTYDNTAMELDDIEKQEAAVAAALEKATRRPIIQRIAAMDESDLINSTSQNLVHAATADLQDKLRLSRTIQFNESIEEECLSKATQERKQLGQTLHQQDAIEDHTTSVAPAFEQEYIIRRQTLHFTEAIDEDTASPRKDLFANSLAPRRRQTLHFAEDIDEEMPSPRQDKHLNLLVPPLKEQSIRRRQTLHLAESIEEDVVKPQPELKPLSGIAEIEQQKGRGRQTLHFAEDIEEDTQCLSKDLHVNSMAPPVEQEARRRRQTLQMSEPIEEDLVGALKELKSQAVTIQEEQQPGRRRQTIQMAEPIEEDPPKDINTMPSAPGEAQEYNIRRQTLHYSEDIEEDFVRPPPELQLSSVVPSVEKQSNSRRQTLHLAEPIEEDLIRPQENLKVRPEAAPVKKPNKEDIVMPQPAASAVEQQTGRLRRTLHFAEDIDEEMPSPVKDLQSNSLASPLEQQASRRRQTLLVAEPIVEDLIGPQHELKSQPTTDPDNQQTRRRRQTMQMEEPIEEDIVKPTNDFSTKKAAPAPGPFQEYSIRRQTLHYSEDIEDDFVMPEKVAPPVEQQNNNRRRQTLHMAEFIEEDSFSSHNKVMQTPAPTESRLKHQQTMHFRDAIDEEPVVNNKHRHTLLKSERIEEDLSPQMDTKFKVKPRVTYHLSEPIEEDISSGPTKQKQDKRPRQTLTISESIKDDMSCIDLGVDMALGSDEDLPVALPTEQRCNKSRMTFLSTFEPESLSSRLNKTPEDTGGESQSDSAEWLAQMNANLRKTLVNPIKVEGSKSVLNSILANRTCMETPRRNKTQRDCFHITPGRSMIEYEDLEMMCNSENPIETANDPSTYQPKDMEIDMDVSNCGTPIVASKSSNSLNIKRLPIHLTPNFPQPKKRNMQENLNNSQLRLDASRRDGEDLTPQAKNKSRIPVLCKTLNTISPWRETEPEQEQLDATVQIVRAQMMRQSRSCFEMESIYPPENKVQLEAGAGAGAGIYEDNPITISDVSSHFAAQKELAKRSLANAAEEPKNTSSNSRSSNENSNKSYARAHKKYMNLSGDTVILDAAEVIDLVFDDCEIDQTRLSLVSTLLDEEQDGVEHGSGIEFDADPESEPENELEPEACLEQLNPPVVAGSVDACKKCKHCRRSMDDTQINDNELSQLNDWDAIEEGLKDLERLRAKPSLEEVHKYYELKELSRLSNASDAISEAILDDNDKEERLTLQEMLEIYQKIFEEMKRNLPEPVIPTPFAKRVDAKLRDQVPRWIFDYQLQCDRQYIITHRKITTFNIVINYEPLDIMENYIRVRNIKATTTTTFPKRDWCANEHLLDFQVRLKLPLNLLNLLDGNDDDNFVKFLKHVDAICLETTKLCKDLKLVLASRRARLLRQPNRTVVRKTIRKLIQMKDEAYMRVEKIHFLIEIGNVEQISFKDILQPPLYQFDEKIQFLPKGIDFLNVFLENPEEYLKPIVEPNN
ncbi:uncharacterized protein LOC117787913 [Drosophila innubila]|uniref:uncharacterized protein LOC117787913 n=1 Tax=Drosophila innubila TaxID=198719 RepID=UPI00148E50F5|nr:uncharacterized protein LOC117787913 [Drosophila innubila]